MARFDSILLVLISLIILFLSVGCATNDETVLPFSNVATAKSCADWTVACANEILYEQTEFTLVSVTEQHGMYLVTVSNPSMGQSPLFVTRDCALLFGSGKDMGSSQPGLTASACGDRVVSYFNENEKLLENTEFTLGNVSEERGMFQVNISYMGKEGTVYISPDCSMYFSRVYDITAPEGVLEYL